MPETTAPERLKTNIGTNINVFHDEVEYIRLDLHDAALEQARRDEREQVIDKLHLHLYHFDECTYSRLPGRGKCNCGLDSLLVELEAAAKGK